MKILGIKLTNFRQHKELNLRLDDSHSDFVVIIGDNGFGKSNLLSALSWCLYGRESKAGKNLGYGQAPVNWVVAGEMKEAEVCTVSAELRLEINGNSAIVKRTKDFFKSASREILPHEEETFAVQELTSEVKGYSDVPEPQDWVDRNFPERLEPYFLFDGERLDQFFRDENSALVERAIMQIAQVDRLESVNSRTEIIRTELSRDAARLSKNSAIQIAEAKFEAENEAFQNKNEEFERHQKVFAEIRSKYLEAESKVTQLASESTERSRAAQVIKEHTELSNQLDAKWDSFQTWSITALTNMLLQKAIRDAQVAIQERRENRTLPPKFDVDSLEELLIRGDCVCGREIGKHSDAARHISELIESYRDLSGSGRYLLEISPLVEVSLDNVERAKTDVSDFRNDASKLLDAIKALEDKIPKAKPVSTQDTSDPTQQYLMWQDAHHDAHRRLGELEQQKRTAEQKRDAAQKEFQRQLKMDAELKQNSDTIEFASKVVSETSKILTDWKSEVRSRVADSMKKEFAPMLPKKRFIQSVDIDEKFKVSVMVGTGDEAKDELSSGERQALAFAFSLGLNSISGYSLPMVIDTPFGRMGDEMKQNVAKALARNTQGDRDKPAQQVIILMTDSEYSSEVASTLQARKPSRYRILNQEGVQAQLEAF